MDPSRVVAVTGATGRQGGAVVELLLADGWRVRGLTRHPHSAAARRVAALGAELVTADMMSPTALDEAFRGVDGVDSVQTGWDDGFERRSHPGHQRGRRGAARTSGPHRLRVRGSRRARTGVGSWDSKERVAAHMRSLALPLTVLRPTAFMELMTDRDFYPMVSTWQVMPKVMGGDRPSPSLAVRRPWRCHGQGICRPGCIRRRRHHAGRRQTLDHRVPGILATSPREGPTKDAHAGGSESIFAGSAEDWARR